MDTVVTKRKISLRLDEELLDMLELVSKRPGSVYFDRNRTWLIEHAIEAQYKDITKEDKTDEQGDSPSV